MVDSLRHGKVMWVGIGLVAGLAVGSLLPSTPLHAMATDRSENIVMATGYVDDFVEGVFFLDSLTGMLRGGVPSARAQMMNYQAVWTANVAADMTTAVRMVNAAAARVKGGAARPAIQAPQTPRFLMCTGQLDIRAGSARMRPGRCVIYVAEANTGIVMTYAVPWSMQMHSANQVLQMPMTLWAAQQLPTAVLRAEE